MKKRVRQKKAIRFRRFAGKAYAAFNSIGKMVTIGVLASGMLAVAQTVKADKGNDNSMLDGGISPQQIEEVEVTAERTPIELKQAAKVVTVISRADIEAASANNIQDLLEYAVGLDVKQRGEYGVQADISIRGGTHDQTAVFLNGIYLSNPQTGHYNFDIPVNLPDIERIEIIEGAAAKLYGAGAFAGVVNIVTRVDTVRHGYVEAGGGMHRLAVGNAGISVPSGNFAHQFSAGYSSSAGYMDNSDFSICNFFWQTNHTSDDADFHFQTGYNNKSYGANTFYSASYPNQHDKTQRIFAAVQARTKGKIQFSPQLFWHRHYDNFQLIKGTPTGENFHQSQVFGGKFDANFLWKLGRTVLGGEILNEGILSTVLGLPMLNDSVKVPGGDAYYKRKANRTTVSYFVEHNFFWKQWRLSAGALINYNTSQNGNFGLYPGIDLAVQVSPEVKIYASLNTAFRMPTFTDLYYTSPTNVGNPDLKPERSTACEVGVKYRNNFLSAYITGFYQHGKNMIDWVKEKPEDKWESRNLAKLNTAGVETSWNIFPKRIVNESFFIRQVQIGYAWISQNRDSQNLLSNYVLDFLKHKFTVSLHHDIYRNFSIQWNFRWQDREGSFTQYENRKPAYELPYPPYALLDTKINWQQREWKAALQINNILNNTYYDIGNIPQPGIWVMGSVKYVFNY
ncbi:MAG: TonB-dependent receptor [Bacteroidales bacterium]|jgi:iron complex outermembrane receptor protein|nr:TonB-dependent receptor [Bacteroidales bacterium]